MSLSSLHHTNTLPVHAPALSPSHLFHCSQFCNMRLVCLCFIASSGLYFAAASETTTHKVYCLLVPLSAVTYCVHICWSFWGFFFLVSCCFRFLSAVLIQLCLRCHNIQFPLDSWGFMVNTAQKAQYIANTVFYLP